MAKVFTALCIAALSTGNYARAQVTPGISVLLNDSAHLVRGKRVGLITNHTGVDELGRSSIDLLHSAPGVRIYSLYGDTKVPSPRMLDDVDVLVYDIQDVVARMYTYVWTMTLAAEAAQKAGKQFIVLDRPNPIRADIAEGGLIERRYRSFTGLHNVPARYALTPGELARYLSRNGEIDADITVIPMKG